MNNEPVAWLHIQGNHFESSDRQLFDDEIERGWEQKPLYIHPVKEQLSNGHLSDCAIHNEPASRNKPCNCGFEPKFNLADVKHEDNCRYFDDGLFCTCGAEDSALVEWYRHKEVAHPVKEQDGCGNCHACLVGVMENGLPVTFQRMILCPDCGNKRCPKASNHRHQCTESNEPNQRGSIYTHPVKELTDAEIQQISHRYHYTYNPDYIGFARAILKKAGEK